MSDLQPQFTLKTKSKRLFGLKAIILSVILSLVVVGTTAYFAERKSTQVQFERERTTVYNKLNVIRARLEGNIIANLQLVRGLAGVISTEPDIDQKRFAELTAELFKSKTQMRHIAAAPDMVISLIYPLKGNEGALGLDYNKMGAQRKAALHAKEIGDIVMAGPIDLILGGQGFIARFPVFVDNPGGDRLFWGLLSAVIDVEKLYQDSGLLEPNFNDNFEFSITNITKKHQSKGEVYGSTNIETQSPVEVKIDFPHGSLLLSAIPKNGWQANAEGNWSIRFLALLISILILSPLYFAFRLYIERRANSANDKQKQEQLKLLTQRLELAVDTSQIGVWEMDVSTGDLIWDARMKELYGLAEDDDANEYNVWERALHPDDVDRAKKEFDDALKSGEKYHSEFRVRSTDGKTRNIRAIGTIFANPDGSNRILGVNWDVTEDVQTKQRLLKATHHAEARNAELQQANAQVQHVSLHDSLTELPNRRYLDNILKETKARGEDPVALLHIDLDRFKQINDTLGHAAGDAMLVHAAKILRSSIRADDFLARVGGDEFVVIILADTSEEEIEHLAERILQKMRQPVPYEGHECRFGVSIGIARATSGETAESLLADADIALYRAKDQGRNRQETFTGSLRAEVERNKKIADDILYALERQEFIPFFQPQFDAKTHDIVGVEALVRWEHPQEGLLTPDAFLDIAGELNVVPDIDRIILEKSLWQQTRWRANNIEIPKISVNVSAGRLQDPDLLESLDGLIIDPGSISFELLESIFLDEQDKNISTNVQRLKKLGIDIEIDDFGTGYASIVSLLQLNPKRLKIDRCLVMPIVTSRRQRRLVASIIEIGQSLGIEVTAEGVESMEHAALLNEMGCNTLQGFAFSRPLPSTELMEFVQREPWRKAA